MLTFHRTISILSQRHLLTRLLKKRKLPSLRVRHVLLSNLLKLPSASCKLTTRATTAFLSRLICRLEIRHSFCDTPSRCLDSCNRAGRSGSSHETYRASEAWLCVSRNPHLYN